MSETGAVLTETQHWQKPDMIRVKRDPAFGYRWIRKADVEKRIDEGWEVCRKGEALAKEAMSLDHAEHYRGLILMRMPIHMVKERNQHYLDKHHRRLRATAKGAALVEAGRKVSEGAGGNMDGHGRPLTGAIGSSVIKEGIVGDEFSKVTRNETFSPGDVDPKDLKEAAETKQRVLDSAAPSLDPEAEDKIKWERKTGKKAGRKRR